MADDTEPTTQPGTTPEEPGPRPRGENADNPPPEPSAAGGDDAAESAEASGAGG